MAVLEDHIISINDKILKALTKINLLADKSILTLFVLDQKGMLVGSLTDGDLRRGFINGKTIDDNVSSVMNSNFRFLRKNDFTLSDIIKLKTDQILLVPQLDEQNKIVNLINLVSKKSCLPLDAVIMAGGKGERLRPLTEKTPKPMLRIGDRPILEINIDHLSYFGIENIHITLNYLGEQIENYFSTGKNKNLTISYTKETEPLGTIGALRLIKNFQHDTILLMNADILTNIDLEDFYKHFEDTQSMMSVASIPYTINIPYGVLDTEDSNVLALREKPTFTYSSNAGIYLFKKEALKYISSSGVFNATDLMEILISKKIKVSNYSLLGYWLDIGKPEDFKKAQEDIKHLKF
jgi:dTDP-glucose pyrophosphorylase